VAATVRYCCWLAVISIRFFLLAAGPFGRGRRNVDPRYVEFRFLISQMTTRTGLPMISVKLQEREDHRHAQGAHFQN
jgi:hypothetical protein